MNLLSLNVGEYSGTLLLSVPQASIPRMWDVAQGHLLH